MKGLRVATIVVVLFLLVGCGNKEEKTAVETPSGFDVPTGVTLTDGGSDIAIGKSATIVYRVTDKARSALTVTVQKIKKGSMKDFRFFSLDKESKKSTPFYVTATVKNEGPAGLGGAVVPLYSHDSSDALSPPNELVGNFAPCPGGSLPKSFLPGSTAKVCLVYLIQPGATLVSLDLKAQDQKDAISWKP